MKNSLLRLIGLMLAVVPMTAAAQNNIISAFDAIIKCPDAKIIESHTLDKDPSTGSKTGQSDIYRFVLPSDKAYLIEQVVSAFDKDAEKAYSINRGKSVNTESDIVLTVGDGSGVYINDPDCEYIYSLFLAPLSEDPDGKYRYAYGMNCKEVGDKLSGKLVITYATTLMYRQQVERQRQYDVLRNFSGGSSSNTSFTVSSQKSWFDTMMSYLQGMASANPQTRIALASKAYKLIGDTSKYPEVTDADKDVIREILEGMISDKEYSETILHRLLSKCASGIK